MQGIDYIGDRIGKAQDGGKVCFLKFTRIVNGGRCSEIIVHVC